MGRRKEVPKDTGSRRPIPTPLHQHPYHYLYEGLMASNASRNVVEQLQLLVRRVVVAKRDAQDQARAHTSPNPPSSLSLLRYYDTAAERPHR